MFERDDNWLNSTHDNANEISLIPLINVIFLLLIFFLVAGTYAPTAPDTLDLPDTDAATTLTEGSFEHTKITINLNGELFLGESATDIDSLKAHLKKLLQDDKNHPIIIHADQYLHASHLLSLMQYIGTLGGGVISIATQEKTTPPLPKDRPSHEDTHDS